MKQWAGYEDLVERIARARRDAFETAPRGASNHHLEAAMFLAMLTAAVGVIKVEDVPAHLEELERRAREAESSQAARPEPAVALDHLPIPEAEPTPEQPPEGFEPPPDDVQDVEDVDAGGDPDEAEDEAAEDEDAVPDTSRRRRRKRQSQQENDE